jgi:fused signal recognition particle receptor
MPSGIGVELIVFGALLLILAAAGAVVWLGQEEPAPAERPSDEAEVGRILPGDPSLSLPGRPAVVMIVGANGSGRTTMAGRLAHRLVNRGRLVALTAVDAVRLPAVHQLASWAERAGADLIAPEGATDPGAAAYEAVDAARARGSDVLIVDSATRGQAEETMLDELARVRRVLEKAAGRVDEVLLVLDARSGRDALTEAKEFVDAVGVSGIALSHLDGTREPEVVLGVVKELGVPVKLVGIGEHIEDLRPFDADWFAGILAGKGEGEAEPTRVARPAASEKPPSAAGS